MRAWYTHAFIGAEAVGLGAYYCYNYCRGLVGLLLQRVYVCVYVLARAPRLAGLVMREHVEEIRDRQCLAWAPDAAYIPQPTPTDEIHTLPRARREIPARRAEETDCSEERLQ
jgi:hypothetical protein